MSDKASAMIMYGLLSIAISVFISTILTISFQDESGRYFLRSNEMMFDSKTGDSYFRDGMTWKTYNWERE